MKGHPHSRDDRDRFRRNVTDIMDGYDQAAAELEQERAEKRTVARVLRWVPWSVLALLVAGLALWAAMTFKVFH